MFKCPVCGSTQYKRQNGKYVCKYCNLRIGEREFDEIRRKENETVEKFISETDALFAPKNVYSDTFAESLKKEIDDVKNHIDDTFVKKFAKIEAMIEREHEENARVREITAAERQNARENMDYLREIAHIYGNVGDDLEKSVTHFLNMNPPQYQAAAAKIRLCIENYARYAYGADLTDKFLFPKSNFDNKTDTESKEANVKDIFRYFKMPENLANTLFGIYKKCNPAVHGNISAIDGKADDYLTSVKVLKENKIDCVDAKTGMPLLYSVSDRLLKERTDAGDKIGPAKINSFFNRRKEQENYMKNSGIEIPEVNFASAAAYYEYVNSMDAVKGTDTFPIPETTTAPDIPAPEAKQSAEARHSGIISNSKNFAERGFGFIKADSGESIYFHVSSLRDPSQETLIENGAKVSFVARPSESIGHEDQLNAFDIVVNK